MTVVGRGGRWRALLVLCTLLSGCVEAIDFVLTDRSGTELDAGLSGLDAGLPGLDAGLPGLDAGLPGLDAGLPGLDASSSIPDAAASEPDASPLLEPEVDRTFASAGALTVDIGVNELSGGAGASGEAIAALPDGKILVAGVGGPVQNRDFLVIRLTENGDIDTTFGTGQTGTASIDFGSEDEYPNAIRVLPDGKLLLAGTAYQIGSTVRDGAVARLQPDGALDTSFAGVGYRRLDLLPGNELINGILMLQDGRVRLCGQGWPRGPLPEQADLVSYGLMPDGEVDTGFGTGGVTSVEFFGADEFGSCLGLDSTGRLLLRGTVLSSLHGGTDAGAARLDSGNGQLDPTFSDAAALAGRSVVGSASHEYCFGGAVLGDGKLLCVGWSVTGSGPRDSGLFRFLPDGGPDTSFGPDGRLVVDMGGEDWLGSVISLSDGRLAAGGTAFNAQGKAVFALQLLNADGTLDTSRGTGWYHLDVSPGLDNRVSALAQDARGRLLVLGSTSNGTDRDMVVMRLWLPGK